MKKQMSKSKQTINIKINTKSIPKEKHMTSDYYVGMKEKGRYSKDSCCFNIF